MPELYDQGDDDPDWRPARQRRRDDVLRWVLLAAALAVFAVAVVITVTGAA